MSRIFHVAVREYLENVKTKAFLIGILLAPLLMGAAFVVPLLLQGREIETRRLAVADMTGTLGPDLVKRLASHKRPKNDQPLYDVEAVEISGGDAAAREESLRARRQALDERVLDGRLFAYLVIRDSALDRTKTRDEEKSEYRAANLIDFGVSQHVKSDLAETVNARVTREAAVPPSVANVLTTPVPMSQGVVGATSKEGSATKTLLPFVFVLLLFLTIVTISQALITSTLEEKANRVIEVLLSSLSPFQLMAGKIAGTCAVGLTLMTIWASGGLAGLAINGLPLATGGQLGLCVVFYLLGFVFFASLMVAVGSACNTLKEAQNLLAPVMAVLTLSMLFLLAVAQDPHGTMSRVLSFIPLFTPFLMMLRVAATPPAPPLEIAASIAVLALSAWLAMRMAARVFRVGVLMYGKPPSLRELWRWMWAR